MLLFVFITILVKIFIFLKKIDMLSKGLHPLILQCATVHVFSTIFCCKKDCCI